MTATVDQATEALTSLRTRGWVGVASNAVAALLLAAFLVTYDLVPQPPYGANPVTDAWRRQLLVAAALLVWGAALVVRRRLPRPNLLLVPLLLYFLIEVAAIAAALDPRIGVEPALDVLAVILIFWALTDCPGLSATSIQWALMLAALALAFVCLHFVWVRWQDWRALAAAVPDAGLPLLPPTIPRITAIGTNPNIVAPLMTFTAPLYLAALLRASNWRRACVAAAAIVVQAGIFFTLARAAWIGEAAALAVCAALIVLSGRRGRRLPLRRIALACAASAIVLACLAAVPIALGHRPLWLFRPSLGARSDFRGAALQIVRAHPLLGAGPGSFVLIYPYISDGDPAGAVHAHNIPIQIAVETGLLGLAAAGLVALVAALLLVRAWRDGDPTRRALVACAAGAGAAFLAGGMADSLHLFPEILFVLSALMAAVLRSGTADAAAKPRPTWPFRDLGGLLAGVLPLLLATGLLLVWLRIDHAGRDYARSIDLASKQRWPEAVAAAQKAAAADPAMPVYYVQAALDLAIQAFNLTPGGDQTLQQSTGAATAAALRAQAIVQLQRALALEPRSAAAQLDLALVYANDGRISPALAVLPAVRAGAPRDSMLLLSAGVIEEQAGPASAPAAIDDYAAALAQSPRSADSPFWQETDFRRRNYAAIVAAAMARASGEDSSSGPSATREILSQASGIAQAGAAPAGTPDFTATIDLAQDLASSGDNTQAQAIMRRAVAERPDDPAARLALGNLYATMGQSRAAQREWLAGAYLGDTASIAHLLESSPPGHTPALLQQLGRRALPDIWNRQLGITQQHYRFAYRRQEPWPITLPSDALNAVPAIYAELGDAVQRAAPRAGAR